MPFSSSGAEKKVKIKDFSGQQFVVSVEASITFRDLLQTIAAQSGHSIDSFKLKRGLPPHTLVEPDDAGWSLETVGIKHGDSLILEHRNGQSKAIQAEKVPSIAALPKFQRKVIDDDNSCLFNSVGYVLLDHDLSQADTLRQIAVSVISDSRNTAKYTEVFLGMEPHRYIAKMLDRSTWGGAIELAIFSEYFETEIVAIDVETLTPMIFGEGSFYKKRVFILYSGIHYDAVERLNDTVSKSTTVFDVNDSEAFSLALEVARQENSARRFTNVNKFSLKCALCSTGLVGQNEAQEHAMRTGHASFTEY